MPCETFSDRKFHNNLAEILFGEDMRDMKIDFTRNMAINFGVDADNNGVLTSSVYLGYNSCW